MARSIFISYSHADAAFVREIVRELTRAGIDVSFDEMERLQVGDVLTERLRTAIERDDYLGVVLSPSAVASTWVHRELQWAMETEHAEDRVKVLPLIAEACDVPAFLQDKVRLELVDPEARRVGLVALAVRLGADAYETAARIFPLLGTLAAGARVGEIHEATVDAIVESGLPAHVLEPFLTETVRGAHADGVFGLAVLCARLTDSADCCYEAGELALRDPRLPTFAVTRLASMSRRFTRPHAIEWVHDMMVEVLRNDPMYNTVLGAHAPLLMHSRYDTVANYLLYPDRGPGGYNIDSVVAAIQHTDRPWPFVRRWVEWLRAGRLDGAGVEGDSGPSIHYACLVDAIETSVDAAEPIVDESLVRTRGLLKSGRDLDFDLGIKHLLGMLERRVPFADRVRTAVLLRVHDGDMPVSRSTSAAVPALARAFRLLELGTADSRELEEAEGLAKDAVRGRS